LKPLENFKGKLMHQLPLIVTIFTLVATSEFLVNFKLDF